MAYSLLQRPPHPALWADLSPKGEVRGGHGLASSHLSLWGRGRREAAGEGALLHTHFSLSLKGASQ